MKIDSLNSVVNFGNTDFNILHLTTWTNALYSASIKTIPKSPKRTSKFNYKFIFTYKNLYKLLTLRWLCENCYMRTKMKVNEFEIISSISEFISSSTDCRRLETAKINKNLDFPRSNSCHIS